MLMHSVILLSLMTATIAVPLNCRSSSNEESYLGLSIQTDNSSRQSLESSDYFLVRRNRSEDCNVTVHQPAVRLASVPNTGTTWLQFLIEEATKIATQNPQSTIVGVHAGRPFLYPSNPVWCRAECGGHLYFNPNCTANSLAADGINLARGEESEIFKNHYPDFTEPFAMFETYNKITKTIVLVRNPVDAYLAQKRHIPANRGEKINLIQELDDEVVHDEVVKDEVADDELDYEPYDGPDRPEKDPMIDKSVCPLGFVRMRNETQGRGTDPLELCQKKAIRPKTFAVFLDNWRNFFDFWFNHVSVACSELVVVHYEDLVVNPESILAQVVEEAGVPLSGDGAIQRAIRKFPIDAARVSYNVYFNKAHHANKTLQDWANYTLNTYGEMVERLGYLSFMSELRDAGIDDECEPDD